MPDNLFARIVNDLANAKTGNEYVAAKRRAERLGVRDQFLMVDYLIRCRRRLAGMGVL